MALRDQPYFPFYVQDYLTDERLLMCSWKTQGIYVRIMCCLHKQEVYGAILFKQNSKQNKSINGFFASVLCKLIPCQYAEMEDAIAELLDNHVLKFDGEKLYQKRMYNDGNVSLKRSVAAKKGGGNPLLKYSKKSSNLFKQNSKQNPEYENENEYEIVNKDKEEKGITKGKNTGENDRWRKDLEIFKTEIRQAYYEVRQDEGWISQQQDFNPGVDILKSLDKMCVNYWATEAGWKQKKKTVKKGSRINWKQTFANGLSQPMNRVYNGKTNKTDIESEKRAGRERLAAEAALYLSGFAGTDGKRSSD